MNPYEVGDKVRILDDWNGLDGKEGVVCFVGKHYPAVDVKVEICFPGPRDEETCGGDERYETWGFGLTSIEFIEDKWGDPTPKRMETIKGRWICPDCAVENPLSNLACGKCFYDRIEVAA